MPDSRLHIDRHRKILVEAAESLRFVVFLCGPDTSSEKPSARLRAELYRRLGEEGFDVILGEDQGLEDVQLQLGVNAQDNELEFIRQSCNAIVVIADSVGSFCELGLFSWHYVHQRGVIEKDTDFILLVDRKYQNDKSYLNEGPFSAVAGFGQASFVDLNNYTCDAIVDRLKLRRGVYTVDHRLRIQRVDP